MFYPIYLYGVYKEYKIFMSVYHFDDSFLLQFYLSTITKGDNISLPRVVEEWPLWDKEFDMEL